MHMHLTKVYKLQSKINSQKAGFIEVYIGEFAERSYLFKQERRILMAELKFIQVRGAREHNLKSVDVDTVSYTHLTLPTSDLV